jgi:hypothetical protein
VLVHKAITQNVGAFLLAVCKRIIFNFSILSKRVLTSFLVIARVSDSKILVPRLAQRGAGVAIHHSEFRSLVPKCCVRCPLLGDLEIFSFASSISIWKGGQIDLHSRSSSSQSLKIRFEPVSRANNRHQVCDSLVNIRHTMKLFSRGQ